MPSRSLPNSFATHALAGLVGMALGWLSLPLWREMLMGWHQQAYGMLVETCDTAMREHLQAKMTAANIPSRDTADALYAAEVGLLVCQDYDLYQKRLLQWGLGEAELAQMRLTAIEARASDLQEVVATHEIRF
jgi:hypothetical protein